MRKINTGFFLRSLIFGIGGALIFGAAGFAGQVPADIRDTFHGANILYREGKYEQAKDAYETILGKGFESGNLYYNLGNAYFKQGKLGRAVLNYERAKRLIPRDSDLKANIELSRSMLEYPVPEPKAWRGLRPAQKLAGWYSLNELLMAWTAVYVLFIVLLCAGIIRRGRIAFWKPTVIITAVFLLAIGSSAAYKWHECLIRKEAVIVVSSADAVSAPAETAVVLFRLFEGARVDIIGTDTDWARVKTPDGKIGWIRQSFLETIAPA